MFNVSKFLCSSLEVVVGKAGFRRSLESNANAAGKLLVANSVGAALSLAPTSSPLIDVLKDG